MGWSPDPELRQMFIDELNERSARLLEGARTMRSGSVEAEFAGEMMREGHTIKGTARVLGFEAVSVGGLLVEEIWRRIQHDELQSSEELALALEALAETVVGAGEASPDTGTVEHYEALTRLSAIVPEIDLPAVTPPDPTEAYLEALAKTVAPQERWITLYTAGLRDGDNQPNYWCEACLRRGPLTREGAQLPARDIRRCFSKDGRNDLCRRHNCYIPETRTPVCMSHDGRNGACQRNGCNKIFRNRDGSTYEIPCYWTEHVTPAGPCHWK